MTATQIALSLFGAESNPFKQWMLLLSRYVETLDGELIPISKLTVRQCQLLFTYISQYVSMYVPLNTLPYLKGLKLANSNSDSQKFTIFIGTDY